MASLALLRKKAKAAGIAASLIKSATTPDELQSIIEDHTSDNGSRPRKKKSAVAKKKTSKTTTRKKASARKASGRKSAPARSKGTAKRRATTTDNGGRNMLGRVNFSKTEGWNPREGSAVEAIFKSLKRHKGDREKVFTELRKNIGDFVATKNAKGEKLSMSDREAKLRYRISRTLWDFAFQTGQHEPSENRAEYGTAGTGAGTWKPADQRKRKATTTKTKTTKRTGAKRGRPVGSKNKTTKSASARKTTRKTTKARKTTRTSRGRR